MKIPYSNLKDEDQEALDRVKEKISWKDIKDIPKPLLNINGDKLNNESITNGAGYQTAHQVNSAINNHDASKNSHPNKISGQGIENIVVYTNQEYKQVERNSKTLYIIPEDKALYLGDTKLF